MVDTEEWHREHEQSEKQMYEAQQKEAMKGYRKSHPLVEKEDKDYLEPIIRLSEEHFNNNPDDEEFRLKKVILKAEWGLSDNPTNSKIAELCEFNDWIESIKKFLVINKEKFYNYQNSEQEKQDLQEEKQSMIEEVENVISPEVEKLRAWFDKNKPVYDRWVNDKKDMIKGNAELRENMETLQTDLHDLIIQHNFLIKYIAEIEPEVKGYSDKVNEVLRKISITKSLFNHKSWFWKKMHDRRIMEQLEEINHFLTDIEPTKYVADFYELKKLINTEVKVEPKPYTEIDISDFLHEPEPEEEPDTSEEELEQNGHYNYEYEDYEQ